MKDNKNWLKDKYPNGGIGVGTIVDELMMLNSVLELSIDNKHRANYKQRRSDLIKLLNDAYPVSV